MSEKKTVLVKYILLPVLFFLLVGCPLWVGWYKEREADIGSPDREANAELGDDAGDVDDSRDSHDSDGSSTDSDNDSSNDGDSSDSAQSGQEASGSGLTIAKPANGSYCGSKITLAGTCSENNQAVEISGSVSTRTLCRKGKWELGLDLGHLADGPLTIRASHRNWIGIIVGQAEIALTKDTISPTVEIGDDIFTNVPRKMVSRIGDASSVIYFWEEVTNTGRISFDDVGIGDPTVTAYQDGIYTIRLKVTDAAGNTGSDELQFTWDKTTPVIDHFSVTNSSPSYNIAFDLASVVSETPFTYCLRKTILT